MRVNQNIVPGQSSRKPAEEPTGNKAREDATAPERTCRNRQARRHTGRTLRAEFYLGNIALRQIEPLGEIRQFPHIVLVGFSELFGLGYHLIITQSR